MTVTSVVPGFIVLALCFIVAHHMGWLIRGKCYSNHAAARHQSINGIRSILALSVFLHHGVIYYFWYRTGRWEVPPSGFYTLLGQVAVGVFFSITGFLFWEKAIRARGVVAYRPLLISRVKRIGPAYLLAAGIAVGIVAWQTEMTLRVPLPELLRRTFSLLFSLGAMSPHPVNGVDLNPIVGVFWTLKFEWRFYLLLPLMAVLLRYGMVFKGVALVLVAAMLYHAVSGVRAPISILFLPGLMAAHLYSHQKIREALMNFRWLPVLGVGSLALLFLFCGTMYSYAAAVLMLIFFVCLVHLKPDHLLSRLLQSRSATLLGAVSYSTYLLHCLVLFTSFNLVNRYLPIHEMTPSQFWMLMGLDAVLLVVISGLSYKYVEYPFMKKG